MFQKGNLYRITGTLTFTHNRSGVTYPAGTPVMFIDKKDTGRESFSGYWAYYFLVSNKKYKLPFSPEQEKLFYEAYFDEYDI